MKLSPRQDRILKAILLVLLGAGLVFSILRDTFTTKHDFSGYVIAGDLAFHHQDIYSHHLNTWPPSFSLISIPLYLANSLHQPLIQFLWLTGFCLCFVLCIKWTYELVTGIEFRLNFKNPTVNSQTLNSWIFIIPMLFGFRILIEEIVNIQINVYLMTLCLLALKLNLKGKNGLAGLLIAFTITCKVYTIILLPFLFFRKKWKWSAYTVTWLGAILGFVFIYFGWQSAIDHHVNWWTKDVIVKHIYDHGNQSIWGLVTGLVSDVERLAGVNIGFAKLSLTTAKTVGAGVIGLIALWVGFVFIRTYNRPHAYVWQFLMLISFIPLFSPIAWKYYFVFTLPISVLLYIQTKNTNYWYFYLVPSLLFLLSSEVFLGRRLSDVTEVYGVITLSSLALSLLSVYLLYKTELDKHS